MDTHLTAQLLLHATWLLPKMYGFEPTSDYTEGGDHLAWRTALGELRIYLDRVEATGYPHPISGRTEPHSITNKQGIYIV